MQTLQDILLKLQIPDYIFISKTIKTKLSLNPDKTRQDYIAQFESEPSDENRAKIVKILEDHIRYLGSSDIAYKIRKLQGIPPGVSFPEIVSDVAKKLKIKLILGPIDEQLEKLVASVASKKLSSMSPKQVEELLIKVGINKEEAKEFLKKHGGPVGLSILTLIVRVFGKEITEQIISIVTIKYNRALSWQTGC